MAMATPCAGCGETTSWICAAQFRIGDYHLIICKDCWDAGKRCYLGPHGLAVVIGVPLYWDEGGYVTGEPLEPPSREA